MAENFEFGKGHPSAWAVCFSLQTAVAAWWHTGKNPELLCAREKARKAKRVLQNSFTPQGMAADCPFRGEVNLNGHTGPNRSL
jgi:hypothetical protein